MKILFVHRDLPPDSYTGVSLQVHRLANTLTKMGHGVTVATFSGQPPDALYHVKNMQLPEIILKLEKFRVKLKRLAIPWIIGRSITEDFDIIHIHGDGGFLNYKHNYVRTFYGTARYELKSSKTIKGFLAQSISYFYEKIENERIRICGTATGISGHISKYHDSINHVVPCMLPFVQEKTPIRAESPVPTLYFIGSVGTRKRGELALALYITLKLKFPRLLFHYISKTLGKDKARWNSLNKGNLAPPVFHNNISETEMKKIAGESWIFISLSTYEGFGVGVIEAMVHGCSVISSLNPGSLEIIENTYNGILSPDDDLTGWANILIENPRFRQTLSDNAKKSIEKYSTEKIAKIYEKIYQDLL